MKKSPSEAKAHRVRSVDFRGGVRGKHYERYRASRITVQLDPDVAQAFPDADSVNGALRRLLVVQYDFSKGVRGKYAAKYGESTTRPRLKRPRKKPA